MRFFRDHLLNSAGLCSWKGLTGAVGLLLTLSIATVHSQELRESTDPYFDARKTTTTGEPAKKETNGLNSQLVNNATFTRFVPASTQQPAAQDFSIKENGFSKSRSRRSEQEDSSNSKTGVSQASFNPPVSSPGTAFEPSQILAVVGTEPIFVADLMLEVNQTIERFMPTAPPAIKQQQHSVMIERLLPKYIEQKMLLVDTKRQLPEEVDFEDIVEQAVKEFDNNAMEKMMEGFGVSSTTEFDAILRAQGSSLRQLRRSWSIDQLVRYFLSQKIQVNNDVGHADMLEYYHQHIEEYQFPAKCRWQQVMVKFSKAKSYNDAQKMIVEFGNQIVYGASMEAVAKSHSDGYKASSGGIHDWTSKGSLKSKEIDDAIFTLPTGVLSDVIETENGLHIIRVIERIEPGKTPFLDAQVEIREKLKEQQKAELIKKHLAQLKEEIPVEIYALSPKK